MTRHDVAKFISRIFSIYALFAAFGALRELLSIILNLSDGNLPEFPISYLAATTASLFIYLIIGFLLWIKADFVAKKFVGDPESPSDKLIIEGENIQSIAYSTIGLFLMVQAIPTLASLIALYYFPDNFQQPWPTAQLITSTVQLILGIWLFVSAKGLTRIVQKLRVTKDDKPTEKSI